MTKQNALTRYELAEGTNLSPMTISNLVDHLKSCRVLDITTPTRPVGDRRSTGRKADLISLCTTRHAWLLLDLTAVHFRFCALALDMSIICESVPWLYDINHDYTSNLRDFLRKTRGVLGKALKDREILGVAVVAPGPYDIANDMVDNQRISALNKLPIKQLLREELGLYDYYVDEDVKFAVRAYMPLAIREGCEVLYYAYIGEGVGGATIHGGNVLRGLNAAAGDVGQLIGSDGLNYEKKLSLRAFMRACGMDVQESDNESFLLSRLSHFMTEDFPCYQKMMLEAADTVGDMLYSVVWLLDPSHIVIDCRYAHPYQDIFISRIGLRLAHQMRGTIRKPPSILPASEGMHSVLYGAAQVLSREWIARIA